MAIEPSLQVEPSLAQNNLLSHQPSFAGKHNDLSCSEIGDRIVFMWAPVRSCSRRSCQHCLDYASLKNPGRPFG
jgi:hypothetical protein